MGRTHWPWLVALAVFVAACGSGGDGGGVGDAGQPGTGGEGAGSESGDAAIAAPEIDPSAMPPAGEAHVEVDGQSFVFRQADMLEGPFECEVGAEFVTINFQSDRHDLLLQGRVQADGTLLANTTVSPEESDRKYGASSGGPSGGAASVDGSHVLFVGRFDAVSKSDPTGFEDAGTGTVAVTCP